MNPIQCFFRPAGVALVGASSNPGKLSYGVLENMIQYGYQGKVYPVNPKGGEILGLKCYPDVSKVPDPVDLAVIMIPAPYVPETLESCGQRGIKAVTIISGGFKEVGGEGVDLEVKCMQIARHYGMRLIGPNCVGTMDLYSGLNTTFIRGVPEKGHIGFMSQSGAVCGAVVDLLVDKGIGFSHFISMGNEADVDETDLIEFLADEPSVRVIASYVEAIRDGEKFMRVARKVSRKIPIVMLKAGRSEAGERAVSSHTGSLAGTYTAYQTAFKQAGVIEVDTAQELFDIAVALASQPLPKGNRAAIITNAGGPAALASDSLAEHGFRLADFSEGTKAKLKGQLNPSAQVANPVDMLGGATPAEYGLAMEACIADENMDVLLPINVPTALADAVEIAQSLADAAEQTEKTTIACMMGEVSIPEARRLLHSRNVPIYTFPEQVGKVLGALAWYRDWLTVKPDSQESLSGIQSIKAGEIVTKYAGEKYWGEAMVRPLLEAYGIPLIPGQVATNAAEAVEAASSLGYPIAMKIVSPDIIHKSDAGAIRLKLQTADEIHAAYQQIMANSLQYREDARIDGVLVEKMSSQGIETIVGMRRDPQFGPLIMFGLGGIYVELFTDIAFRLTPLTHDMTLQMIMETRAGKLLSGIRGQAPADIEAVISVILRLAQLSEDFPNIEEIEINPLMVMREGAMALDARAILNTA